MGMNHKLTKKLLSYSILAVASILLIIACNSEPKLQTTQVDKPRSPSEANTLEIWWDKGFTVAEDKALKAVVRQWEKKTNNQVNLVFDTTDELAQKAEKSLQAGNPPDILMSHSAERTLYPRLAWSGKLIDVSNILKPIKNLYPETALEGVYLYNKQKKKRSYYAIPIHQAAGHIFYWKDLVNTTELSDRDIPQDWDGFWQFWQQVQKQLRTKQKSNIYGLGFPLSAEAGDTYQIFEQILEAYDVQILDAKGRLLVDNPNVRQGIIKSLDWYTKFYKQGYVPTDAISWLNPDNNRSLLNRKVVMTPNFSLSIPAASRQDTDVYNNKLGTIPFPNKPSGEPMPHLVILRQAAIFTDSKNPQLAKDFLSYLLQPQVMNDYLKTSGGRSLPILKPVWSDPYWTNPKDPHLSSAAKTLNETPTRLFYYVRNPAYSVFLEQNIWGKALNRIVVDEISPEQAADEAIAQIKEIFAEWE